MLATRCLVLTHQGLLRPLSSLLTAPFCSSGSSIRGADLGSISEDGDSPVRSNLIVGRKLTHMDNLNPKITIPRETWIDNFDKKEIEKRGLIPLHPRVFGVFPRVDMIQENLIWQEKYKKVNWLHCKTRWELAGKGPRPWPQKGTGRARHKDKRSPIWHLGGWAHPSRAGTTSFYNLNFFSRVQGLISALTIKHTQGDLIVVDTLDHFPSDDPKVLEDILNHRSLGPSVLFIDKGDIFPKNIALASDPLGHINLMPVYGLNVHSMLKHTTLILTVSALEQLESKLLFHLERTDIKNCIFKFKPKPLGKEHDPYIRHI